MSTTRKWRRRTLAGLASLSLLFVGGGVAASQAHAAVTWTDTSLLVVQPTNNAFVHRYFYNCIQRMNSTTLTVTGNAPAEGHSTQWDLSQVNGAFLTLTGTGNTIVISSTSGSEAAAQDVNVTVSDGYGDIANAVIDMSVTGSVVDITEVDSANCVTVDRFPTEQSGGVQFDAIDSSVSNGQEAISDEPSETDLADTVAAAEGFTWSADGLPAGLSINSSTGFIAPGTAAPGQYGVKVTATDSSGAASTITFTLQVNAVATKVPTNFGDYVNPFGNGIDVFQQHWVGNTLIVGWTATKGDPATHFVRTVNTNGGFSVEAVNGKGIATGLCVSDPVGSEPAGFVVGQLTLRGCNNSVFQGFSQPGGDGTALVSDVAGAGHVEPNGTGNPLVVKTAFDPWGGFKYTWTDLNHLP